MTTESRSILPHGFNPQTAQMPGQDRDLGGKKRPSPVSLRVLLLSHFSIMHVDNR
jgi:hypothetical protein